MLDENPTGFGDWIEHFLLRIPAAFRCFTKMKNLSHRQYQQITVFKS